MEDYSFFDQQAYSQYMDDLNNSQGFYVTPQRDGYEMIGAVRPIREYSGDKYQRAVRAAQFAVEECNKHVDVGEQGLLKFLKIVNLNTQPTAGTMHFITMAVADASGETVHYQAKVWEKINTGYQVKIFRRAPYWLKSSDKLANKFCCVGIDGLLPWMNESYIYYKCFYRHRRELAGVEVIHNEGTGVSKGVLWLTNCGESEKNLNDHVGQKMPCTDDVAYHFDSKISHTH